jgi:hypothetical protein
MPHGAATMTRLAIGTLTLYLHLPGCSSLKEKRGRLQPLLARLRREFNVSTAEIGRQDAWQDAIIACGMVASGGADLQRSLQTVAKWVVAHWPEGMVVEDKIEIL